jgi:hypothetical protein
MKKGTGLILSLSLFLFLFPQVHAQRLPLKGGIKLHAGIPNPIDNPAFKKTASGVFDIELSPVVNVYRGFLIGLTGGINQFKTPPQKIPDVKTVRNSTFYGGLAGYEFLLGETTIGSITVEAGNSMVTYEKQICQVLLPKKNSGFIRSNLNLYFVVDPQFALGAHVSYTSQQLSFDPYSLCLDKKALYYPDELGGKTNYYNFGFSLYYLFLKNGMTFNLKEPRHTPDEAEE